MRKTTVILMLALVLGFSGCASFLGVGRLQYKDPVQGKKPGYRAQTGFALERVEDKAAGKMSVFIWHDSAAGPKLVKSFDSTSWAMFVFAQQTEPGVIRVMFFDCTKELSRERDYFIPEECFEDLCQYFPIIIEDGYEASLWVINSEISPVSIAGEIAGFMA
jgi:hypothetical protein